MGWALWLAIPAAATVLTAAASWWRSRPVRVPGTDEAMRAHGQFLDALTRAPRGDADGPRSG